MNIRTALKLQNEDEVILNNDCVMTVIETQVITNKDNKPVRIISLSEWT